MTTPTSGRSCTGSKNSIVELLRLSIAPSTFADKTEPAVKASSTTKYHCSPVGIKTLRDADAPPASATAKLMLSGELWLGTLTSSGFQWLTFCSMQLALVLPGPMIGTLGEAKVSRRVG